MANKRTTSTEKSQAEKKPRKARKRRSPRFKRLNALAGKLRETWSDPRVRAVAGVGLLSAGAFTALSLVSGLFTGAGDYSAVHEGLSLEAGKSAKPYANWAGGAGAHVSYALGRRAWGLGALALPLWMLLIGFPWLSGRRWPRRGRIFRLSLLGMLTVPWAIAFIRGATASVPSAFWDHWVGDGGAYLHTQALRSLGALGSGLALLTIAAALFAFHGLFLIRPIAAAIRRFFSPPPSQESAVDAWPETETETPMEASAPAENVFTEPDAEPDAERDDDAFGEMLEELTREEPAEEKEEAAGSAEIELEVAEDDGGGGDGGDGERLELEVQVAEQEDQLSGKEINLLVQEFGEFDPTLDLSRFELPGLDLLMNHGDGKNRVSKEELEQNKDRIIQTLRHFSIEVSSIKAEVGPTVTLYEIVPAPGIRISKIKNLTDDIALSLAALGIRIIAPIPGRGTIGIEVPNSSPDVVSMRALIASDKFQNSDAALPIVIGKTISGESFVFDLAKMPHVLMAGATGQGKSVGLNAMLVSLLYRKHPSQLKFVLVDPKKVELTLFNHIERHYLAKLPDSEEPIITDTSQVVRTLNSLCVEMDLRYDLLKDAHCRNLKEYNEKFVKRKLNPENGHRYLPYIVLVIDEFADLIMTAGREVETPIARLAQLARAIGIHLIIATQRPSVKIITGTIKANFPARIAFRVSSSIDSRTILDSVGADQLIGRGDMLINTGNDLIRLQCGFVDTPEVEEICEFIGCQQGYPDAYILPEVAEDGGGDNSTLEDAERDAMFEDAARVIVQHQQGSTSLLQRKLKLGYNRAGRIIDQLETAGIIGPFEGSKARKVLVLDETSLDQMLHPPEA